MLGWTSRHVFMNQLEYSVNMLTSIKSKLLCKQITGDRGMVSTQLLMVLSCEIGNGGSKDRFAPIRL